MRLAQRHLLRSTRHRRAARPTNVSLSSQLAERLISGDQPAGRQPAVTSSPPGIPSIADPARGCGWMLRFPCGEFAEDLPSLSTHRVFAGGSAFSGVVFSPLPLVVAWFLRSRR